MKTAICTKKTCLMGAGVPQPLEEFIDQNGRHCKTCNTCRQYHTARRQAKGGNALSGYGKPLRRTFNLAPHHYLLDVHPWHRFGRAYAALHEDESKLKLLRSPDGRPTARRHADLKPGEVSLVLE